MRNWLHDGDTFTVDRDFRDSADVLSDIGIRMEMLCFLRGAKLYKIEISNSFRLIIEEVILIDSKH